MADKEKGKKSVGKNVSYEVTEKNVLVISIDLNKTSGPSKSGKTVTIGTSQGNVRGTDAKDNEFIFGVNCYKYEDEE